MRARRLAGRIAAVMSESGAGAAPDPVRLGLLWLDSDVPASSGVLYRAAAEAFRRLDTALCERLAEAAIRAAFDVDQDLFRWAMDRQVFLASPATILPLIMLIAHGWKQFRLSEKAHELSQVVSQLGDRIETFVKRLGKVQSGLDQATRAWNEAIDKSWYGNQSVQKSIEKARELGGSLGADGTGSLIPLDHSVRAIESQ